MLLERSPAFADITSPIAIDDAKTKKDKDSDVVMNGKQFIPAMGTSTSAIVIEVCAGSYQSFLPVSLLLFIAQSHSIASRAMVLQNVSSSWI